GNGDSCNHLGRAAWGSKVLELGYVPVIVDPDGETIDICRPFCIVDARMLKKQLPSQMHDAPLTIGLGPGFIPGKNVNFAVETMRGPELGVCLADKEPLPDTGIPGVIAGESKRRVFKASVKGVFTSSHSIGDLVKAGDIVGYVGEIPVRTEISGVLRGLLRSGLDVVPGEKLGDTDPRGASVNVGAISDKAMKIGQSVLETIKGIYLSSKNCN
ncbi:MAG: molybdenum hydroxylase, partial [bacterium]|nr:molybdenum hydroxylase [bacterium]